MATMCFTIRIGFLAGTIESLAVVAARLGVVFSYAKLGGFFCKSYRCVATGDKTSLNRFRDYLWSIQSV